MGSDCTRSRTCVARVISPPRKLLYQHSFFCDMFSVFCFAAHHSAKQKGVPFGVFMNRKGEIKLCLAQQKQKKIEEVHRLLQHRKNARVRAHVYEAFLCSEREKKSVVYVHIMHNNSSTELLFYIPTEHPSAWWVEEPSQTLFFDK